MQDLIKEFYNEFNGVGTPSIVRTGTLNDAFEVVVLKIMYGRLLDLTFDRNHIDQIQKYIIAPPDSGIDIFVERGDPDDPSFDVIQCKYSDYDEADLRSALLLMKRTVKDFCESPEKIASINCRKILSASNLASNNMKNCHYYVVHNGETNNFSS